MVENIEVALLAFYVSVIIMFTIGLYISRYLNSPYLFYFTSIICSISTVLIYALFKLQSSWFVHNTLPAFLLSAYNIILSLKFLELAFGYKWSYIQQMPVKLAVMYLCAMPQMPESEAKFSELSAQNVRKESILNILHGFCQVLIRRTLLYLVPFEWLSLSSTSLPLSLCFFRYGLLSIILYLSIACAGNFGFGIYSLLFNIRMKSGFPSFPFASTSLRDFWSYRWNNYVKSSLHLMSFFIIPKLIDPIISMSKSAKGLCAFMISGFIHEYALRFISDKWSGRNMMFFLLHGLLVSLEITFKLPAKPKTSIGKLMGWMWTIGIMFITAPLFFDPLVEKGVFSSMKE